MIRQILILSNLIGLIVFLCWPIATAAQVYEGTSNIQLLHGKDLSTVTVEHAGAYRSFNHFGFADIFHVPEDGTNVYTEWYPKVSLVSSEYQNELLLSDILFGAGVNSLLGQDFVALLAGPVWQFNVATFELFQLETYYYRQLDDESGEYGGTYQLTYSWSLPISLSQQWRLLVRGFFDYIGDRGPGVYQIVTQPQLLLDVGNFWNKANKLYAGSEWNFWNNINGIKGKSRSILQAEIIWFF